MIHLPTVTQIIIDCVDTDRACKVLAHNLARIEFASTKLLSSIPTVSPYYVSVPSIRSIQEYSVFCLRELHRHFSTPHVLVVQHDGWVERPELWDPRFLDYDYIGSPWWWEPTWPNQVGNGGFSLRSHRLQSYLAACEFQPNQHEDLDIGHYMYGHLISVGFKFAPLALAEIFGAEGTSPHRGQTFGFHDKSRGGGPV